MCGDNSIAAHAKSAKLRLEELAKVNPATKLSGYESQFKVTGHSNITIRYLCYMYIRNYKHPVLMSQTSNTSVLIFLRIDIRIDLRNVYHVSCV